MNRSSAFMALSCAVIWHATAARAEDRVVKVDVAALKTLGIETAVAKDGALRGHITCPAYIESDPRKVVRIRATGEGRISRVLVYPGQIVKAGQPLIEYHDHMLEQVSQQLQGAQAAVEEAKAARDEAALAAQRGHILSGGALAHGEVQRRETVLRHAEALVREKTATLEGYRMRMGDFTSPTERTVDRSVSQIVAPIGGVVRSINTAMGEGVSADSLPLVEIDDLSTVWVVSQVLDHDAQRLSTGAEQVTMLSGATTGGIHSTINSIDSHVDPQTRQLLVRSLVDNSHDALRPGTLVTTELDAARAVSGEIVPSAALQQMGGQSTLFVQTAPDRYVARQVTVGPEENGQTVITQGLSRGDVVVTQGSFALKSQMMLVSPDGGT